MRLAARWLGAGVTGGDFVGCVAAAHDRACVIATEDGLWLTLACARLGALPGAITLATPAGFAFRPLLAEGAAAAARGGVLRVAGSVLALAVDLRGARPWRSNLEALRLDLARPPCRAAWHEAATILAEDGRAAALLSVGGAAIDALDAATRGGDAGAARQAVCRLIGLGAGRTPDGDDFLVGYLAGLRAAGAGAPIVAAVCAHVAALAARTGDLSRHYLRAAAAGEVGERLHDVAAAIAAAGPLAPAMRAALALGHGSGAAGVLGLLHGAAAR